MEWTILWEAAGDMMIDFSIARYSLQKRMCAVSVVMHGEIFLNPCIHLNCINGSWWLDRCYAFNDPDHMCPSKVPFNGKGPMTLMKPVSVIPAV